MIKILEKSNIKINGINYIPLAEANLNRIASGYEDLGYAIVSAYRQEMYKDGHGNYSLIEKDGYELVTNPKEIRQVNNINTKKLKDYIKKEGYSYIEVFGGYRESGQSKAFWEKSFLVFPFNWETKEKVDFDEFFKNVIDWIQANDKGFNQDSVLIKRPNENPRYYDKDGKYADDFEFIGTTLNDITQEYFTALKKWDDISLKGEKGKFNNGKPQRFTFTTELYIRDFPKTINEHRRRSMSGEIVRFEYYPE